MDKVTGVDIAGLDNDGQHFGSDAYSKSKMAVSKWDGVTVRNMTLNM